MSESQPLTEPDDRFDLHRFLRGQHDHYDQALGELLRGRKSTHWMWFIFPQYKGLGFSSTSKLYAIQSPAEARAYWNHPELGTRLRECFEAVLSHTGRTAHEIFGSPDDMKLRSCATLFQQIAPEEPIFGRVLEKFFKGIPDSKTIQLLSNIEEGT